MIYLNRTELATETDKSYEIDLWGRMFKSTTQEEIDMLAQQNEYLKEAASGIAVLTEDEQILQQCQAREDFEYWERMRENKYKRDLAEKDRQLVEKEQELARLNARIAELESKNK